MSLDAAPKLDLATPYQLVWCHDLEAAITFYHDLIPDAQVMRHRSGKYAELEQDGRLIAIARTDIHAKARLHRQTANTVRFLVRSARDWAGGWVPRGAVDGPDRLKAAWA